jgi:hypothetical protein
LPPSITAELTELGTDPVDQLPALLQLPSTAPVHDNDAATATAGMKQADIGTRKVEMRKVARAAANIEKASYNVMLHICRNDIYG